MNFRELIDKNRAKPVLLRPKTIRLTANGQLLPFMDDEWRLSAAAGKSVQLHNMRTNHCVTLGADNIREFRTPHFLMLNCRLTLQDRKVHIEPFVWR